ncbi:MAG: hypothetical protein ACJAVN_000872 [Roseivirga sp.]|jgi:hypothetical protein
MKAIHRHKGQALPFIVAAEQAFSSLNTVIYVSLSKLGVSQFLILNLNLSLYLIIGLHQ